MKMISHLTKNGEFKYSAGKSLWQRDNCLKQNTWSFRKSNSNHISFVICKLKMVNSHEYIYFRKELSKSQKFIMESFDLSNTYMATLDSSICKGSLKKHRILAPNFHLNLKRYLEHGTRKLSKDLIDYPFPITAHWQLHFSIFWCEVN